MADTERGGLFNVCILGLSFMLLFTGFQTMTSLHHRSGIAITLFSVLTSLTLSNSPAVITLAVVYSVMAIFSWLAPSLLVMMGPRTCLLIGASFYILYCFQLVYTSTVMAYSSAVLLGAGASIIWVAQGYMLANNSDQESDQYRNSAIFWVLFHLSGILGNIFVLFVSSSYQHLNQQARKLVPTLCSILIHDQVLSARRLPAVSHLHWRGHHASLQEERPSQHSAHP